ncbi:hypothetical protein [Candidatus Uabimicrobium sp. HlEnr_7]|uniref:hypothetical protein n=1 Tax=Candidatus Uabimicrobium helgolandensis TaxID=3095367 RepID=UPI003558D966
MDEWFEVVVEILQSHKDGEYSILEEAQSLPENAPLEIQALLCMSLCQVAMDANKHDLAIEYLKLAIKHADQDATNMVQHEQLFFLECLLNTKFLHSFDKTIAKARGSRYKNHYLIQSIVGDCLYWCGHFSEALETYQKIINSSQAEDFNSEEYEHKIARTNIKLQKYSKAQTTLERIVQNHEVNDNTPDYVFHSLQELITLNNQNRSPQNIETLASKVQGINLHHPYKKAYVNHICGLSSFFQDNLEQAESFFHKVLQAPIRDFEKLPSVVALISLYHKTKTSSEQLTNKYSFANMFWEKEIQQLFSPKKVETTIDTEEPYEEVPVSTTAKEPKKVSVKSLRQKMLENVNKTEINTPLETNAQKEEPQQKATAQKIQAKAKAKTKSQEKPQQTQKNELPEENTQQETNVQQEEKPYDIPLSALLLGIESLHKQS